MQAQTRASGRYREAVSAPSPARIQPLVLTGERTLPGIPDENYWFRRHEAAYRAVVPFVTGAVVLEAGCGEGYGADVLAESAHAVVGLDYDQLTSVHARTCYPQVQMLRADLQHLPLRDNSVGVVACLQVIEHLWDQPGFLRECARVLGPAGTLLLSTPNRLTFSPGGAALNPFHTRELSAADLADLLSPRFVVSRMLGLRHGRRLRRFERKHGSLVDGQTSGAPDTWPATLRRAVHRVRIDDFVVTDDDIDASLDLVVVARARTDADS
jgi:SAM-dependent methyltransferase